MGSRERAKLWEEIALNLSAVSEPRFSVSVRSVTDRVNLVLIKKHERKVAEESKASGIAVDEPSEFDAAIEEICEKAEAAKRSAYISPIIPFGIMSGVLLWLLNCLEIPATTAFSAQSFCGLRSPRRRSRSRCLKSLLTDWLTDWLTDQQINTPVRSRRDFSLYALICIR